MPRNPKTKNTDALHAIHRGETPPYHQIMYCIKQGWATRERLHNPKSGKTWSYAITDAGREVMG